MAKAFRQSYAVELTKASGEGAKAYTATITTKQIDRMGDVVDPEKLDTKQYLKNPVVLFGHDPKQPIGRATALRRKDGAIEADFVLASTERAQEIATLIDEGVLNAVSIGFRTLEAPAWNEKRGGYDFGRTELNEFSVVSVPANAGALLQRAAPVPDGPDQERSEARSTVKEAPKMASRVGERIAELSRARQEKAALAERLLMDTTDDNRAMSEDEQKDYDAIIDEVKRLDQALDNHKRLEADVQRTARPVASPLIGASVGIAPKRAEKGIAFARYAMAMAHSERFRSNPLEVARMWRDSTPEVELAIRAAISPGTTTGATWAAPLMPPAAQLGGELIELIYPRTILGNLSLRNVPFNVRVPRVTTGAAANWVGEGKAKPVSAAAFDTISLAWNKLAVISVLSDELIRFSDPAAEAVVRDLLSNAIIGKIDETLISNAAASAGVSPAGLLNGVVATDSTGKTLAEIEADLLKVMSGFVSAGLSLSSVAVVMSERTKLYLSMLRTATDAAAFPELANGTLRGMNVIASAAVPIVSDGGTPAKLLTKMIFIAQDSVLLARDPGITVATSREASIEMSNDPETDSGSLVSMFQTNMTAILLEHFVTWAPARTGAVAVLDKVEY